jgi:hypothetical protein
VEIGKKDVPKWVTEKSGKYTSSETWEALREKQVQVVWWKLIWFPPAIPKPAFILWLVIKDALTTGDRLLKWGYQGDAHCIFCRHGIEDRDNLFFQCSYSSRIWKGAMSISDMVYPPMS